MKSIYIATLETRNFSFEGFGMSDADARAALERGLIAHAKSHHLAPDWWRHNDFDDDIQVRGVTFGAAYRDGELL